MGNSTVQKRSKFSKMMQSTELRRGIMAIFVFLVVWQFGALIDDWTGYDMLGIGLVPPPVDVLITWADVIPNLGYWQSWVSSFQRVLAGFLVAMIVGIPFGLMLAVNKYFRGIFFPPFEILRPTPPLAWVPASLIFWPTNEMLEHVMPTVFSSTRP